jgi:rhodanese-related sulfurtransferase
MVEQMEPAALKQAVESGESLVLLDVREPMEIELSALPWPVVNIPLQQLPQREHELDPDSRIVVICHHGVRSMAGANWLEERGYSEVYNLTGGIDRYAIGVDPSVGRY